MKAILILYFILLSPFVYSQQLRAYYTLDRPSYSILKENMILFLYEDRSEFLSYDKIQQRVSKVLELQNLQKSALERIPKLRAAPGGMVSPQEIYRKFSENDMEVIDFLGSYYSYQDLLEPVKWQILPKEKKQIMGLNAIKAQGVFRGRSWEVWYTEDVPVNAGPWMLAGLPGLILEAKDTKNEVHFTISGLEKGNAIDPILTENEKVLQQTNTKNRRITYLKKGEFFKLKSTMLKDPEIFEKQVLSRVLGVQDYGILNKKSWIISKANPLDKTEKY